MRFGKTNLAVCVLAAAIMALPVSALGAGNNQGDEKDWTLMMYWVADNNLEFCTEFAMSTWEEALPDSADVNIVALVDILSEDGVWIWDIVDGERHLVDTWDELNTSDPAVLETFVEYAMDKFPSEKTMLVLQDHGYSWRGICQDETNGDVLMPIDGIASALGAVKAETGKQVDVLAFDACNMMTIEVVYELRDAARYIVGSQTMVPFDGLPYRMFISDLVADPGLTPAELATNIVNEYVLYYSSKWDYYHMMRYSQEFATACAVDTSKLGALGAAFGDLSDALLPIIPDHMMEVEAARGHSLLGIWTNMAGWEWNPDLVTFAEDLRAISGHPELISAIDAFELAYDDAVIAEAHSKKYKTAEGLSFWFPPSLAQYNSMGYYWARQFVYHDIGLDIVAETSWYDCLMAYYEC